LEGNCKPGRFRETRPRRIEFDSPRPGSVKTARIPQSEASVAYFWKRFKRRHIKPLTRRFKPWRQATYAGIRVHYKTHLDGGGTYFGQDFIPFLRNRNMPKQWRAFEWCAGPGFIGFSMLGHGLCDTLCLADINDLAVDACKRTIDDNALAGRVSAYHSDNLKNIPASERWDLVVSNPPHFDDPYFEDELRAHDPGWRIHREFLADVGKFLKPDGVIVLQENNNGSTAETFREMIEASGLQIVFVDGCAPQRTPDHRFYYIGIMHKGATPPAWAKAST
jgi:predicted RNA methylase